MPPQTHGVSEDLNEFEPLRAALRNLKGGMKAKFKERNMFPLVYDMWFYSENISDGQVQLQFRGKGELSRRSWPAEVNTVTQTTYKSLRQQLGVAIDEVYCFRRVTQTQYA